MTEFYEVVDFSLSMPSPILMDLCLSVPAMTALIVVFLVLIALVLWLYKKSKTNEKANEIIAFQTEKLKKETRKTLASIEYAKSIQDSFLNRESSLTELFPSSSLFTKSRNIVSGDLFFIKKIKDAIVLATIDCSGHGVPGAFMSLIAHQTLNKVVENATDLEPHVILYDMHIEVMNSLGRNINSDFSKEGMDVSLCVLNPKTGKLKFSGARSSLLIQRGKELIELKGNLISIGGMFESYINSNEMFDSTHYDIKMGDRIYMFSDGIVDQFGGETGKKLNKQGLKNMILNYSGKSTVMSRYVETFMKEWKNGKNPQVDDMLFLNIEIE